MAIKPIRSPVTNMAQPDIFHAAKYNDVGELANALVAGQGLNQIDAEGLGMTPMHVACIFSSNAFIAIAVNDKSFDPWIRDINLRVAFDHASAKNNISAMRLIYPKMYPDSPPLEP
jgi:ankyrin repeat protein